MKATDDRGVLKNPFDRNFTVIRFLMNHYLP